MKVLELPGVEVFGGWEYMQEYLKEMGDPLFSIKGDLDLRYTKIESLDNLVSVGGNLDLTKTPLSEKYSEEEIRKQVEVVGKIYL